MLKFFKNLFTKKQEPIEVEKPIEPIENLPKDGKNIAIQKNDNSDGNTQINNYNIYPNKEVDKDKEITKIPRRNPKNLIGRNTTLERIRKEILEDKQIVLLNAMGGLGKTALAEAYTFKYYDDYDEMVWLSNADESDDPRSAFVSNERLMKRYQIQTENKKVEELFEELCSKMNNSNQGKRKLLVLDNFNQKIEAHLRTIPQQPNWDVLFTSRQKIGDLSKISVDFLESDDAFEMFKFYYCEGECSEAEEDKLIMIPSILKIFGYHTLTIEILAKAMRKRSYDFDTMIDALKKNIAVNDKTRHSGGENIEKIKSYLIKIFSIVELNEAETNLLKQFVCLPGDYIAFYSKREERNLCHLLIESELENEEAENKSKLSETLIELYEKGWLMYNAVTGEYKMHTVVKEVLSETLNVQQEDITGLINKITRLLSLDATKENPIDKFKWTPFGTAILKQIKESTSEISTLQNNLALRLQGAGDYSGAQAYLEKALISDEKNFGPDHPTTAVSYSNLALVLKALGNYSGAQVYLEKALISDEKNFGPDHPTTAVSYSNLALVLKDLGDYSGAKAYLEKALISAEKNFGPDHPTTAVRYSNLALVLQDLGDYSGAKAYLEKALISAEKNFGPDHPTTANRYNNFAGLLYRMKDYELAFYYIQKAKETWQNIYPQGHPRLKIVEEWYEIIKKEL